MQGFDEVRTLSQAISQKVVIGDDYHQSDFDRDINFMMKLCQSPFLIEEADEEQSPKLKIPRFNLDDKDEAYCVNTQTSFMEIPNDQ